MTRSLSAWLATLAVAVLTWVSPALAQGTLRAAFASNLNTLDPAKMKNGEEYIMGFLIFSGLTEIDSTGRVIPDLAEGWEASPDQKVWTFRLRPGARFHHGREVDSEDVKVTIERVLDRATGSVARVSFELIDRIDVIDPRTIRFTLKQPYSGFADILSDRQVRIVPRDRLDTLASEPVGSGPFRFKLWRPNDRIELEANRDYFVRGIPRLEAVTFRIIPESASQIAALETGQIDLVWNLPLEAIEQFQKNRNIVVASVPTSTWDGVIMNGQHKPFDDERVRRAIQAAIDRDALVEVGLFGNGTPTHTMISPAHPYFNKELAITRPDLDLARRLLAEAGFPKGFEVTLYVPSGRPTRERVGVAVREMLKPLNISVNVERVPWDRFVREIEGKAPFFVDGFFARPTIDTSIYPFFHSSGSWNNQLWHYRNADMDRVLDAARSASTEEERTRLYREFQKLAIEHPASVIPYVQNHVNAHRANVRNFRSSPMMWLDLRQTTVQ